MVVMLSVISTVFMRGCMSLYCASDNRMMFSGLTLTCRAAVRVDVNLLRPRFPGKTSAKRVACHSFTLAARQATLRPHHLHTQTPITCRCLLKLLHDNHCDHTSRPPELQQAGLSEMPGFDFSNHNRNLALHAQGVPLPKATSTGTTIVGCLYNGGVVIAADTRATSGPIVADKVHSIPG